MNVFGPRGCVDVSTPFSFFIFHFYSYSLRHLGWEKFNLVTLLTLIALNRVFCPQRRATTAGHG